MTSPLPSKPEQTYKPRRGWPTQEEMERVTKEETSKSVTKSKGSESEDDPTQERDAG